MHVPLHIYSTETRSTLKYNSCNRKLTCLPKA